jgi:hypothetical protein
MNIWLPAGDYLAERIYVNRIQNKNLQNLYPSHTDLCSRDPSRDKTTVRAAAHQLPQDKHQDMIQKRQTLTSAS